MSILLGILVYASSVLYFCALTRANGADDPPPFASPPRAAGHLEPNPAASGALRSPEMQD
jgi:hypothetical protein